MPLISTGIGVPQATQSANHADGQQNPTLNLQIGYGYVFNGSTWDRVRGLSIPTITTDAGTLTASGSGKAQYNFGNTGVQIYIVLGAVTGTTPTCVFKLQGSVDGGANWFDIPGATTASLTASFNVGITVYPGITPVTGVATTGTTAAAATALPGQWRVAWTIGGTSPSFALASITYNYLAN